MHHKLGEGNYLQWWLLVTRFISGKDEVEDYLSGGCNHQTTRILRNKRKMELYVMAYQFHDN